MTVKELIEELLNFNENLEVYFSGDNRSFEVPKVTYNGFCGENFVVIEALYE